LRYDYVGANGNDWIETPNMDRLAAQSWSYDRCFSASYPTIPHRTDVMTGRYGGPFHPWRPLRFDLTTLPEILALEGYCTQLIHDTPHLVNGGHNFDWPFHAWTFVRGAEVDRPWIDSVYELPENWGRDPLFNFVEWDAIYENRTIVTYARANRRRQGHKDWSTEKLFSTAARWLRDNSSRENFFLWLDCFDPHEPWDVPREFARMYDDTPGYDGRVDPRSFIARNEPAMSEAAKRRVKALYAAKVSWVDSCLGNVLDALDDTGLMENTAIVLTADHGTNVGEWGRFGKGYPVREQEGHVPLFIHVPDLGSGRSDILVQPQDIHATIKSLAGMPALENGASQDVLSLAREGRRGLREMALTGRSAETWTGDKKEILFTLFDEEYYLQVAANPTASRLTPYGSVENVADENRSLVKTLQMAAIGELERRGADPALVQWLHSEGETPFPADCRFWDAWPGPAGFTPYFNKLYTEWEM
jgi:arylsulfatase A-like enzyme